MGTVGSGIFVLPYLFYHSNFVFSVIFLFVLGAVTLALNHFYSHIVASTKGDHQLAGYSRLYLGKRFGRLATLNLLLLSFGAMAAYYKLFISFLGLLWPFAGTLVPSIIYLLTLTVVYRLYFKPAGIIDLIVPIFMLSTPVTLFVLSFLYPLPTSNLYSLQPNFSFFGAVVYALSGFTIIPEVQEILLKGKLTHALPAVVNIGMALVIVAYLMFAYGVVSISNGGVTIDTVTGLSQSLPLLAKVMALFGSVVVLRASFGFLIVLRELFFRDLHFSEKKSDLVPLVFPLIAILLRSVPLVSLISITGTITIFVSALLICLIRFRLPTTFWTQFWAIAIMFTLTAGLVVNLIF
jgi:hypothetical protein